MMLMFCYIFVITFLCCQSKKTLKNLLFFSVDNIEKFILKNIHPFIFHVLFHVKAFAMKIFAQYNEISLTCIASTKKKLSYLKKIIYQKFEKIGCSPRIHCQTFYLFKQFI